MIKQYSDNLGTWIKRPKFIKMQILQRLAYGILIIGFVSTNAQLKEFQVGVAKAIDVVKEAANFTPTLSEVGAQGKDYIFGLGPNIVLEAINKVCSLALATQGDVKRSEEVIPELANVSLIFLDNKENRSFGLDEIGDLLNMETFNKNNPVVVLTTGWLSMEDNKTNGAREDIYRAYSCRGNTNFFVSLKKDISKVDSIIVLLKVTNLL